MGGGFSERQLLSIPPHLMAPHFLGAMLRGYWTYWYPIGKSLSSQSERSFKIPKQSIVIEPNKGKKKPRRELFCNQGPQNTQMINQSSPLTKTWVIPIIMWMFSGSKPLRNFLRKLIPSKSTNTLLKTSNPFSGTTLNETQCCC